MGILKVGDKIVWNIVHGGSTIYTVLGIDVSREPYSLCGHLFRNDIHLRWEGDGIFYDSWHYCYETICKNIMDGRILIVGSEYIEPKKYLNQFKF